MTFGAGLIKKLFFLMSTQVVGMGMAFIAHLLLIKLLSTSEYGVFSFIFSVSTILCLIGNFGFQASSVRIIPQLSAGSLSAFLLRSSVFVFIFSTGISGVVFFVLSLFISKDNYSISALWAGALIVPFFALIKLYSGVFKGLKKGGWAVSYENTFKETLFVGLILFCISSAVLSATSQNILFLLLSIFIVLSVTAFCHLKKIIPTANALPVSSLKLWLTISYPMMFVIATQTLIHRADIITLGFFVDPSEVGVYAAAAKIAQAATFGFIAMNIIFSPMASEYFHQSKVKALKKLYVKTGLLQLGLTILLGVSLYLSSDLIFSFFDTDYQNGLPILYLLIGGYILNCVWGPVPFLMIMTKYEHQAMWLTFFAAALNIVLNIIFIQKFGIIGAALATVITLNLRNVVCLIYVIKRGVFREKDHG